MHVLVCFILDVEWFLHYFPKKLNVGYFFSIECTQISHIPKLHKALSKPIREQDVYQPVKALWLLSCCCKNNIRIISKIAISLFDLVNRNNLLEHCSFEVFFAPLIFDWLAIVCRSLCFTIC